MPVVLAVASALVWGVADFCGGLAARRASALAVVVSSHVIGLLLLVLLLPWLGGDPTPVDLAWGAAAGLAGGTGLVLFYRALAGAMTVVAPVTAVTAAAVPVGAGILGGERIGPWAAAGIALALAAVVMLSASDGLASLRSAGVARLGPAVLAGVVFGLFFVLLDRTGEDAGLSPLLASRIVSVLLLVGLAVTGRRSLAIARPALPLVALAGVGDVSAGALFLLAIQSGGPLALTGVLTSLYPASTVGLALLVLRERLVRIQWAGLGAAVVAVVLIALPV